MTTTLISILLSASIAAFAVWFLRRQIESDLRTRLLQKENEAAQLNADLTAAKIQSAAIGATAKATEEANESRLREREQMMEKYLAEISEMRSTLKTEFQAVASQIMDEKSVKFAEFNKVQVEGILEPLKSQLGNFRERMDAIYKTDGEDRAGLKAEIEQLRILNGQITNEAHQLTTALKGNAQARGSWGELVLERLLESAGLRKDQEYITQATLTNEAGNRVRPDVILRLPDDRHLVVDSKCSLIAYEQAVNANDDGERKAAIAIHVRAVKKHIEELSQKQYEDTGKLFSPDYVLMFVPIESAFIMAMESDTTLYDYALDRKIVLCTAPTLLVTLKTAAMLWKQDRQSKNMQEIVKRGGMLYDKFVAFYDDLQEIGNCLKKTQNSYESAVGKLKDGRGNLLRQVEDLKTLGAKANKSLPPFELLE